MHLAVLVLASLLAAVSNAQYNPYSIWDSYPDPRYNHFFRENSYYSPPFYGRSPAISPPQAQARFGTVTLTLTTITRLIKIYFLVNPIYY